MVGYEHLPGSVLMPAYTSTQAIVDDIQQKIRSGEWPPGTQLPSGTELMAKHRVSRMPVRTAMTILKVEGWIIGAPGKGMFVAEHPPIRRSGKRDMT